MYPLIPTALHRDYNGGVLYSLKRTGSIGGNIPSYRVYVRIGLRRIQGLLQFGNQ